MGTPVAPGAPAGAGPHPSGGAVIEVRVSELRRLFNEIDPSPVRERDLDPGAEAFIVEWARELPADAPLSLRVHVGRPPARADEAAVLTEAIHQFFAQRAEASRRQLRRLFSRGRTSLLIGLAVLGASIAIAELVGRTAGGVGPVLHESLLIGGWVAMWRPLEVFLYDWWPIRADVRLFQRLAAMPVSLDYTTAAAAPGDTERWRRD
ncbi:MAG TPA: hypothetical protein VFT84_05900 [Gemmatimonadales bacterium]|nr:hypothetical protein [Gemmatimonadales bacterium]